MIQAEMNDRQAVHRDNELQLAFAIGSATNGDVLDALADLFLEMQREQSRSGPLIDNVSIQR